MNWKIRDAEPADIQDISQLWHDGWRDGHFGLVPDALYEHRTLDSFIPRVAKRIPFTRVAIDQGTSKLLGFVTINGDELEQFFLAREARGTGLAMPLMREGEEMLRRSGHTDIHLVVVAGNDRAIGFYEKDGWVNKGEISYAAEIDGGSFDLPCLRFEKSLNDSAG